MLVEIDKKTQQGLISDAVFKAGSERRLEKIIEIPDSSINAYKKGTRKLPYDRFKCILSFLSLKETNFDFELTDLRHYQVKGGKAVYRKYLKQNRFEEIHKKMRKASSERMKRWHKKMKKEKPEEYYKLQYSRFKKVAEYKFKTRKGEFVRNELEQSVANKLFKKGIKYDYEPFVRGNSSPYFPDFKVGNTIIECTMWRGVEKAYSLAKKIKNFEKEGFEVKVVIPERLRGFYKPIEKNIIYIEQLEFMPR